ncbi:PTS sugar transporter subunit IIA [Desulfogranum japonicum]|uniref:PTS sugar transporter subunit IIA n=1 Tax=Desulfogranum japonicum TaxID=231447 RepID=UPI00048C50FB|nr:PTS sugar transporter subunit IIA [Desulfogranum japonicum]
MSIVQLQPECILLNMQAVEKEAALKELAGTATLNRPELNTEQLFSVLLERERIGSTGVGNGVAIPHGKIADLTDIILCFGRSIGGIYYDAIDERPVHLFALLLSPTRIANQYLQALAHVSSVLKQEHNRRKLLDTTSSEQIVQIFNS